MRNFTEQELVRRGKLEKLNELGLDPFGQKFDRTDYAQDLKEKYKDVEHEAFDNMDDEACVAGRIMLIRKMGKASFFTIKDKTGNIQIYISVNDIGEESYNLFKSADLGVGLYLLAAILFFIIPIPSILLDVMLALNMGIALVVLFNVLYVKEVLDMSYFPTLLLFTTIFRISLNV